MPKKYRIEMTLLDDAKGTKVGKPDVHNEQYEDDATAEQEFAKKVKVARDTGKGSRPG
jgi:hypothetical protein